ncbi:hypothetical protein DRH27_02360 [Candidatus Falkowbacteria bacterium]|nr:MAG: hypothetical protein DRH27_02360 [Candidatus Falkowbacteria bacterium]
MEFDVCPFTIIVDTREQEPFTFGEIKTTPGRGSRTIVVPIKVAHLPTGDYAVSGLTDQFTVERKSLSDLFGTVGGGRDRFVRELGRMDVMPLGGFVVVERSWESIRADPPEKSEISPASIEGSIRAWRYQFRRVGWVFCLNRRRAAVETFELLRHGYNAKGRSEDEKEKGIRV